MTFDKKNAVYQRDKVYNNAKNKAHRWPYFRKFSKRKLLTRCYKNRNKS